jgi:hypothetical protein
MDVPEAIPTEKSPSVESVAAALTLASWIAPPASPLTRPDDVMLPPLTSPSAEKSKLPEWMSPN